MQDAEAWASLEGHLAWAAPPWVAFVFADDPDAVKRLRERAVRAVDGEARVLQPDTPQALRERLRDLIAAGTRPLVWLEALHGGPPASPWTDAWDDLLLRLNERREKLRQGLQGGVVIAAPIAMKPRIREAAPDLWSIRSLVLDVDARRGRAGPDDRAARSNAYRIAEAVLRTRFHLRMHQEPWFALVIGDDPAPRRRLLEALVDAGLRVRVHSMWGPAVPAQTDAALHWLAVADDPPLGLLDALDGNPPPSAPVFVEGTHALEANLRNKLPDLVSRCALVIRLYVERALNPGPLPHLEGAQQQLRDAWNAVTHARRLEGELTRGRDDALRRQQVEALGRAIEALLAQGWGSEAAPLADEMLAAAGELPETDAGMALRADAHGLTGAVSRMVGDLAQAREHYDASLPLRRELARGRGSDRRRRRAELARCLSQRSALALQAGDLDDAEAGLREALAIRRRLVRGSDDRETMADVALSWSLLGDLELARHDVGDDRLPAAKQAILEALRIREQLAGAHPGLPRFRRMWSISLGRLGSVSAKAADWKSAHEAWAQARDLAVEVSASDSGNVAWRMEASVASSRLGDAARALGDPQGALVAFREAVRMREAMVAEDPENASWQELLAVALGREAEAALGQGDLLAAATAGRRATQLSEQLAWMDPTHLGWRRGLASSWIRRGDIERARGRPEAATSAWQRAWAVASQLADLGTDEAERRARQLQTQLQARGVTGAD